MRGSRLLPRVFVVAAVTLSAVSGAAAVVSFVDGALEEGLLLSGITVFAAWMATAILQFQQRLASLDEVVGQSRQKLLESTNAIQEMRRAARRLDDNDERPSEDRTLH